MSIVRIFDGKSTPAELLTNGIGSIDAYVCQPYEAMNGEYSCSVSIPRNSKNADAFVFGAIIKCSTPRGFDLFRLDVPESTLENLTVKAWHVSNDLGFPKVLHIQMLNKTGQQALTQILTASSDEQRFSGTSDITEHHDLTVDLISPQAAIMNTDGACFLNRWGGELERNNFAVNVWQRLGSDKGYRVTFGKNLMGVTETSTGTGYTNRYIPKCVWGAMDSGVLSAYKAGIDAECTHNNDRAAEEKTQAYTHADDVLSGLTAKATTVRDREYAEIDKAYEIDHDTAKRDAAKTVAANICTGKISAAGVNRTRAKALADSLYAKKIAQNTKYANELKAIADKRFSEESDARKIDIYLPEGYLDSAAQNVHDGLIHAQILDCPDIKVEEKDPDTGVVTYPTVESAYTEMRNRVAGLFDAGADVLGVSVKVSFINLGKTEEYKHIAALNTADIQMGDTIHCHYFGRDVLKRVSEYTWNSLSDSYVDITIGGVVKSIAEDLRVITGKIAMGNEDDKATFRIGDDYKGVKVTRGDGLVSLCEALGTKFVANDEKCGYYDMATDAFIGGLANVGGVISLIAGTLTNDPTDPECYATIGYSAPYYGIFVYRKSLSTTVPVLKILLGTAGDFYLQDSFGTNIVDYTGTDIILRDSGGKARYGTVGNQTYMRSGGSTDTYIVLDPAYQKVYIGGVLKQTLS